MKKILPPVLITAFLMVFSSGYAILYFFIFSKIENRALGLTLLIITALLFACLFIAFILTLKERIIELKKEDEDDYRKY